MTTATAPRKTADERREAIIEAAREEFACRGLHGASADEIARKAGISQPYLFRLFGTKKELYLATVERCFARTLERFQAAAEGLSGERALEAIGAAYGDLLAEDPIMLRGQMQAYAACDDPAVREVVREGYGRLYEYVERVSGATPDVVASFFAGGMLFNVMASMGLDKKPEPWAGRLMRGCKGEKQ